MNTLDEVDISLATGTWKVKAAASVLGVAGVFFAFTGIQLFLVRFRSEWLELVPWVHVAFAVALVFLAAMTYRARTWAAIGSTLIGGLAFLGAVVWQAYAMFHGIFSLLGLASVPAALAATGLAVLAIGDASRATAVRKKLHEAGMNLGF
ncbi:MAG: hypothetical protein JRH11_01230 [Deltaproteobacteria bacterium]|nr:hypothetical protein [Deltaproteobacteria bacterium]